MRKPLKYSDVKEGKSENHIVMPPDLFIAATRGIMLRIKNIIEFRGYEALILDFSNVESCFPDAILPILSQITGYRKDGVQFDVVPPNKESLFKSFVSANWLHLIDPKKFSPFRERRKGRVPAREFINGLQQHEIVNELIDGILSTANFLERDHLRALEWAVNEITDNVLVHSDSDTGGIVQLTLKEKQKEIEFVVSDSGIGIPDSLGKTLRQTKDSIILEQSIREGVTRGTGQGNGLFGSAQICIHSKGAFSINSGRAFLAISRSGELIVRDDEDPWIGTSVDCSISYDKPLLLEKALKFNSRSHMTVDIIENNYEEEDGAITFKLCDETDSVGSRLSGRTSRVKLENLYRITTPPSVTIDACNVGLFSSSFADEFFGGLITLFGFEKFEFIFRIIRLSNTNYEIINRSLNQRFGRSLNIDKE